MTDKLKLTMACGLYDRMLDLYTGDVQPDGITLNFIRMDGSAGAREIFDGRPSQFCAFCGQMVWLNRKFGVKWRQSVV